MTVGLAVVSAFAKTNKSLHNRAIGVSSLNGSSPFTETRLIAG